MRRVRYLEEVDYIIPIRQKAGSISVLSSCTINLERSWFERSLEVPRVVAHAKFNASTMDGIQVTSYLSKGRLTLNSVVSSANLYRVSDLGWANTLVGVVVFSSDASGVHTSSILQSSFASSELSGKETYMLDLHLARIRKNFRTKLYFNHLGCFDSLNLLRQRTEELQIVKADD